MRIQERLVRGAAVEGVAVTIAFVVMLVIFSVSAPSFLTGQNLQNLLVESVFVILLAAGMTYVVIVGGIDLSVGSVLGFSAGMTLFALNQGAPVALAVLVGVGTGAVVGLVNGAIIAGLGVNDFIVTLATFSLVAGALQVLASKVDLIGSDEQSFTSIAHSSPLGIPTPILITVVVLVLLEFVLLFTPFGRRIYAAGINGRAAHLAGVNVRRLRFQVYLLSGAIAGFAGVLIASHLNSVQPSLGSGFELTAIAAAVIGGISLAGGQGTVWRSVVGALFLSTLNQGLSLLGIDPVWFTIVTGASIVAAVALSNGAFHVATRLSARAPLPPVPPVEPPSALPADEALEPDPTTTGR